MEFYNLMVWNNDEVWKYSDSKFNIKEISSWYPYSDYRISVGIDEYDIYIIESGNRKCWKLEEVLKRDPVFIRFLNEEHPGLLKVYEKLISRKNEKLYSNILI